LVSIISTLCFCGNRVYGQKSFDSDPYAAEVKIKSDENKLLQSLSARAKPDALSFPLAKTIQSSATVSVAEAGVPALIKVRANPSHQPSGGTSFTKLCDLAGSELVYATVINMPTQGTYSLSASATENFKKAMAVNEKGELLVSPKGAVPSFCSSATYLVFLASLVELQKNKHLNLKKGDLEKLLYARQPDGVGVWGRWNANGPGTARLFQALELGENFTDIEDARRGDFLKIWWTDEIGAKERGHSVIYLGTRTDEKGVQQLKFWSSNIPGGYGEKEIPITKAKHLLFSRLSKPQNLDRLDKLASRDEYLVSMSSKSFTIDDVLKELGITKSSP
jgi:hypothetical protein